MSSSYKPSCIVKMRIDANWDDRLWQPDRSVLVASGMLAPGIERRHFRDQRYGRSADYGADTHVFRDDRWIGRIMISTSTLVTQPIHPDYPFELRKMTPVTEVAISLFTIFLMFWAVLVIIGSFFRAKGFNFAFPWNDGIFFDL